MESGSYWQPPVWFYLMAPVIGILGYNIIQLRLVSMLVGLCVIWATFLLARRLELSAWTTRAGVVLLAVNPNFVTYVKLVRMDALCVLLTLLGLIAYATFIVKGKSSTLVTGGVLFGFAVLTHPLGLIGPAVAGCHALTGFGKSEKLKFSTLVWIILPVVVAIMFWFVSATNHAEFWIQVKYQFGRKVRPFSVPLISFVERYRSLPIFALLVPAGLNARISGIFGTPPIAGSGRNNFNDCSSPFVRVDLPCILPPFALNCLCGVP
jgi:4-amino-4-deoxy-L-arabinose transferase-like glycosyltransferase